MHIRSYTDGDLSTLEKFMQGMQEHMAKIDPLKRARSIDDFSAAHFLWYPSGRIYFSNIPALFPVIQFSWNFFLPQKYFVVRLRLLQIF